MPRQQCVTADDSCFPLDFITMAVCHLKSTAMGLFVQQLVRADCKELNKGSHYMYFVNVTDGFPPKEPVLWKTFPLHAVIILILVGHLKTYQFTDWAQGIRCGCLVWTCLWHCPWLFKVNYVTYHTSGMGTLLASKWKMNLSFKHLLFYSW